MYKRGLFKKSSSEQASQDKAAVSKKEASDENFSSHSSEEPDQVKKAEKQEKRDVIPEKYVIEKEKPCLDTDAWYANYREPPRETSQPSDPKKSSPNKKP